MTKPRLLDLFAGAGGASRGYQLAGFHVTGVDLAPQPNYIGDEFHQADAMTFPLEGFDAIHASPPCQRFSSITRLRNAERPATHPDLVGPCRERLQASGLPWVIENVVGAPMVDRIVLCGSMFGLRVRRHRLFESNVLLLNQPCRHSEQPRPLVAVFGDHPEDAYIYPSRGPLTAKRAATLEHAHEAMGIDWMTWQEITQAIPPAFTEYIGAQILPHVPSVPSGVL